MHAFTLLIIEKKLFAFFLHGKYDHAALSGVCKNDCLCHMPHTVLENQKANKSPHFRFMSPLPVFALTIVLNSNHLFNDQNIHPKKQNSQGNLCSRWLMNR